MTKPATPRARRAKSSGSITERRTTVAGKRRYEARVSTTKTDGSRRQIGKTFADRNDAQRWLTATLRALDQGTFSEDHRLTVAAWMTRWLATKDRELRPTSRVSYRSLTDRYLIPHLGARRLDQLKPSHLSDAYAAMMAAPPSEGARPIGPATIQKLNAVLRSALADAERDRYVSQNVASLVRLPKVPRPQARWWDVEHVRAFTEHTREDRHHALWLLLLRCGLRRGEGLGLRWEDIELGGPDGYGQARIARQVTAAGTAIERGEPKTKSGVRVVVLDSTTTAALRSWRKTQATERLAAGIAWHGDPEVFTDEVGRVTRPDHVTKRFAVLVQSAGLPSIRLHDARHTAASQWLAAGVPLKDVSGLLGHSSISITADTYGHVLDDSRTAAARAMSARLGDAIG